MKIKLIIILLFIPFISKAQIVNITGTDPQIRNIQVASSTDSFLCVNLGTRSIRTIYKGNIYGDGSVGNFNYGLRSLLNNNGGIEGTIAIGLDALRSVVSADYNTAIGFQAGYNYNSSESVFIGAYRPGFSQTSGTNNLLLSATAAAALPNTTASNQMNLGNVIWATGANGSSGSTVSPGALVGIGINAPTATLHIDGSLRFVTGNQGVDKILRSDANGNADWITPSFNANITMQDEGVAQGAAGVNTIINFTGTGVTATNSGNTLTVNVSGGSGLTFAQTSALMIIRY